MRYTARDGATSTSTWYMLAILSARWCKSEEDIVEEFVDGFADRGSDGFDVLNGTIMRRRLQGFDAVEESPNRHFERRRNALQLPDLRIFTRLVNEIAELGWTHAGSLRDGLPPSVFGTH